LKNQPYPPKENDAQQTIRRGGLMGNITKKDLVERISDHTGLTQVDTKIVVESFLEAVSKALREGHNIEIRGFGRFKIKTRKARMARNPRTNVHIQVEAGVKPVFEASKEFRKRINDNFRANTSSGQAAQMRK
jgi:DNA-binding protein HU-beta/integration host factor subunit beta